MAVSLIVWHKYHITVSIICWSHNIHSTACGWYFVHCPFLRLKSNIFYKLDWSVFMWKGCLLERASLYQTCSPWSDWHCPLSITFVTIHKHQNHLKFVRNMWALLCAEPYCTTSKCMWQQSVTKTTSSFARILGKMITFFPVIRALNHNTSPVFGTVH